MRLVASRLNYGAGVTGQGFSNKINDELTLFACNSGLQALQKCQPKTCLASRSEWASCSGPPVLRRSALSDASPFHPSPTDPQPAPHDRPRRQ
jgi:hypothetical protein